MVCVGIDKGVGIGIFGKGIDTVLLNVLNTSSPIALAVLDLTLLYVGRHKGVGYNTCGEGGDTLELSVSITPSTIALTFLQSIEHLNLSIEKSKTPHKLCSICLHSKHLCSLRSC